MTAVASDSPRTVPMSLPRAAAPPRPGRDWLTLAKPKIVLLVLVTVLAPAWLAAEPHALGAAAWHACFGTAMLAAGASAFNHVLERRTDALMKRTATRPLPAGRISVRAATWFATALSLAGFAWLAAFTTPLAFGLGVASHLSYVVAYTPLKLLTPWNTVVGAVPGALPTLIGWAAVRGSLDPAAWMLFALLFVWQFPHFLAIAWLLRDDYRAAGVRMLPCTEFGARATAPQAFACTALLIAASVSPPLVALGGGTYALGAGLCGAWFLALAGMFLHRQTAARARALMFGSLLYLPAVLGLLTIGAARR